MSNKQFVTAREFAEFFGLDITTVYRLIERGEIPATRIGRSIRIPVSALKLSPKRFEKLRIAKSRLFPQAATSC